MERKISQTPQAERPRERCLSQGPECLSLRELLALLIGSGPSGLGCHGVAQAILQKPGSGLSDRDEAEAFFRSIESAPSSYLQGIRGLGEAGRARILAALELGRRHRQSTPRFQNKPCEGPKRLEAHALSMVPHEARSSAQEWIGFVPVYRDKSTGYLCIVEKGSRTHVNFDPVELFARLLPLRPFGFYLFHNHPSGDLTPSYADAELTDHVRQTASALGVQLIDHFVVSVRGEMRIRNGVEPGISDCG